MGRSRKKLVTKAGLVAYARVSTAEQASSGLGLEAQQRAIEQYAALYKAEIVALLVDRGVSGKSLDRPEMAKVLAMLDRGEASGVIVAKLDRLTRSVSDLGNLITRFFGEQGGRQLVSVSEQIDTRSASGRLVLNVLASVGQWEREAIVERITAALAAKKARGERAGSLPFGFELDPKAKGRESDGRIQKLRKNATEQATIKEIIRLRSKGMTTVEIADELNRQKRRARGKRWYQPAVWRLLKEHGGDAL